MDYAITIGSDSLFGGSDDDDIDISDEEISRFMNYMNSELKPC